ncbi:mechanosensitive ion channel family protein [Arenivirga flava]|uniref:Mechanosensitive ion channel protein MscS n=1 Tax=Arenivirga flava TaxID=1930060 RepID=A0AA37XCS1_9MICO|nr:mechanosensitive ion channel family protein [Arenivirga flava]GMA28787.1 mechanosensitive ion channel protein MscS [Arenivirga flava]
MPFALQSWPSFAIAVVAAVVLAFAIGALSAAPIHLLAKRRGWTHDPAASLRRPFRILVLVVLLWIALSATLPIRDDEGRPFGIDHVALIVTIVTAAWLLSAVVASGFRQVLGRYPLDVVDNRVARRVHTQLNLLNRIAVVVIWVLALGSVLLTFPGVSAVGTSLLASAGLVSVVAGLAAQSTLANVFAGFQLAFSDAIRVDDVVIAEGQWGKIEEITLTYVVVHLWDDRRLVLPSTYFTTTPFENWTRRSSELLGAVEIDLDWRIDPDGMRERLDEVLEGTDLWDGRTKVLQLTDATNGYVRVRVLVTAKDAGTLFDLRCLVREQLVAWIHSRNPAAMPRTRLEQAEDPRVAPVTVDVEEQTTGPAADEQRAVTAPVPVVEERTPSGQIKHQGLFTGSEEAERRAELFTSSIPLPHADDDDDSRIASEEITVDHRGRGDG